jgi:primary-amine oxidase
MRTSVILGIVAALALAAGVPSRAQTHPFDPLTETEILQAAQLLIDGGVADPGAIFQSIELRDAPKARVLAFESGGAPPDREATVFFRQGKRSYRSDINLTSETFTPPALIPRSKGQLGLTITEVSDFSFLFSDPAVLAALAARGISDPDQFPFVFVTPLTPGSFGLPAESQRIVRAQLYYTEGAATNLYARPIEGLQVVADLDDRAVLQVIDTGVVPIPTATHEFDEASVDSVAGLRPQLKPIVVSQPDGTNFTRDGNFVEWQKWRFHVRFERRSGPVISAVTYDGRSVLHQGSLAEIFVPYQEPDGNWYYRTFMDAGEFGFGLLGSPLVPGLDVPAHAELYDALVAAAIPDPTVPVVPLPLIGVVGIFERLTGQPEWRHFELFSGGAYEGRAEVELVVRSIAQVGNYDYAIDWIFTQSGALRGEVNLTGIDAPKSDPEGAQTFGTRVTADLVAPNHSHFFSFRLDLDVDGPHNSFSEGDLTQRALPKGHPRSSVWTVEDHIVARERGAVFDAHEGVWRVLNPARSNAFGNPTAYAIESHDIVEPLLAAEDYQRAAFVGHGLWLTAFNRDERYAAGDTPNQNPGTPGLPHYQADNQNLIDSDIVAWLTLGHHHVTAAEDWPVLTRKPISFELRPMNFFDRNPALDLRRAPFEAEPAETSGASSRRGDNKPALIPRGR